MSVVKLNVLWPRKILVRK